jgi:hypothetical protein
MYQRSVGDAAMLRGVDQAYVVLIPSRPNLWAVHLTPAGGLEDAPAFVRRPHSLNVANAQDRRGC